MSGTIYKAAAGALLQQMRLDVLSNNLANVNTAGYKADKPVFRVPLENTRESTIAVGQTLSPFAPPLEHAVDFSAGSVQQTQNDLDVAIIGSGFFEVQTAEGPQYTRKGSFTINENGLLSTADGNPVLGEGGEIAIEGGRIEINANGEVFVDGTLADTLRVVDFQQPYDLRKTGDTLFMPADENMQPQLAQDFRITQGFLESSNVDAIRTMTEIIETMRVFESYQRIIRSADETNAKLSEVGRSV